MSLFSLGPTDKPPVKPHAAPKDVRDISPLDVYVRVTGVVVESASSYIIVDDGTGAIRVLLAGGAPVPEVGKTVRVFGSVSQDSKGSIYINAEIIQDMSSLDLGLYRIVKKIKKSRLT
ncbi:MAG: hypothetical protein KIH01_01330 [Candidatus Freyarchaeota archaeon]|nr:hypothetical protein [Candidatus Jordarchaeia archaeon]